MSPRTFLRRHGLNLSDALPDLGSPNAVDAIAATLGCAREEAAVLRDAAMARNFLDVIVRTEQP